MANLTANRSAPGLVPRVLKFIRFSHTIFALPFAVSSMVVAAQGWPKIKLICLIMLAMVFARTAAMAFNRVADWEIDQENPRTATRHLLVRKTTARWLVICSAFLFLGTAALINPLCFTLSPVALAVIFFYSLSKRFTSYTQLILGLSLAIAPVGAWLAVTGAFAWAPVVLALGVLCWVAGFDLIYATLDYDFDRTHKLHSMVVKFGIPASLRIAQILHAALFVCLVSFGFTARLGYFYFGSLALILGALVYEHRAAATGDLASVNRAFFQSNSFVSIVFVLAVVLDVSRKGF